MEPTCVVCSERKEDRWSSVSGRTSFGVVVVACRRDPILV